MSEVDKIIIEELRAQLGKTVAERDSLAETVSLMAPLVDAAINNAVAWEHSVLTECDARRDSRYIIERSKADAIHYRAKAEAKERCVLLCEAVRIYRGKTE